jgi:hypothetical protein
VNGTVNAFNSITSKYNSDTHFTLNPSGSWVLTSGNATNTDSSGAGFNYNGSGTFTQSGTTTDGWGTPVGS